MVECLQIFFLSNRTVAGRDKRRGWWEANISPLIIKTYVRKSEMWKLVAR